MEDKLLQTVSDELCKHFNDPIDIECSYCEAAKAVIPLVRADMQRDLDEWIKWVDNSEIYWRTVSTTKHDYYIPLCLVDTWQDFRGKIKSGAFKERLSEEV